MTKKVIMTENQLKYFIKENRKVVIDENIKNDIETIITEELGISSCVEKETEKIKQIIVDNIKNLKPINSFKNYDVYENEIIIKCFNVDFILKYLVIDCKDYEFLNNLDYSFLNSLINPKNKYMNLKLVFFNHNSTKYSDDIIQHELTHLYEFIKRNNNSNMSNKSMLLYNRVNDVIYKYRKYDGEKSLEGLYFDMGYALYSSFKSEQNAFFNSLDAQLKYNSDYWEIDVKKSEIYNNLLYIRYIISNFDEVKKHVELLFQISPNKYLKILKNAEKRILRGIGRVVAKNKKSSITHRNTLININRNFKK